MSDQPATFEDMADEVFGTAREVLIERQRKYGPHNVTRHMLKGIAVRLADKLARLDRAAFDGVGNLDDESVEDTLIDIANYALIGMCMRRGWWTPQGCPPLSTAAIRAHVDVQPGNDVLVTDDGRVFAQIGLDADVSDSGAIPPGYRRTNSLPGLQESTQRFEDGVRNTLSRLDKGRQQPKIIGR